MRAIYTTKFCKIYPDDAQIKVASNLWARELRDFDNDTIDEAINRCISCFAWPPSIGDFKGMCKSISGIGGLKFLSDIPLAENYDENYAFKKQVDLGGKICGRIKNFFPDSSWASVIVLFGLLKEEIRKSYSFKKEEDFLKMLSKFKDDELHEILKKFEHGENGEVETVVY